MTENIDIADLKRQLSEMEDRLKDYEKQISDRDITIDTLSMRLASLLNKDRWATVQKFCEVAEDELCNTYYLKNDSSDGETLDLLSEKRNIVNALREKKYTSMFKSKKQGRYYKISDIVNVAIDLGFIIAAQKGAILGGRILSEGNSKTRVDLEAEGFEISDNRK